MTRQGNITFAEDGAIGVNTGDAVGFAVGVAIGVATGVPSGVGVGVAAQEVFTLLDGVHCDDALHPV